MTVTDLSYPMYDTAEFGASGSTEHNLFQSREGSTATRTKAVTNSRGDGSFPAQESYRVERIGVMVASDVAIADRKLVWQDSYLTVDVGDRTVLQAPLRMFAKYNSYSGALTQATAALTDQIGAMGDGYELKIPILIQGGTSFRVSLYQATALSGASKSVVCLLDGVLTIPN